MTLTSEQQAAVQQWAESGATLNDIQQRLKEQFGLQITYLEARLLMVDLKVKVQDKPREKPPVENTPEATPPQQPQSPSDDTAGEGAPAIKISMDELAIQGAMVSGKVTFTDGKTAAWYIDQMGRLGMRAPEPGYQPPPNDVPAFQAELDRVLAAAGF
jgi:hypothetical protein